MSFRQNIMRRFFASTGNRERSINTSEEIARAIRAANQGTGEVVTPDIAITIGAFYACVRLLAESVGQLDCRLYERTGNRDQLAERHRLFDLLAFGPNTIHTPQEFQRIIVQHVMMRGNFYALKEQNTGALTGLIPLDPDEIEPKINERGEMYFERKQSGKAPVIFARNEILHIRAPLTLDGLKGLSVLSAARKALGLAVEAEKHGQKQFENGVRADLVLEHPTDLSDEAYKRLKEDVDQRFIGSNNWLKPMILEGGLSAKPITVSNEDMQFIESRKFQRGEIAMFCGIPPHMIGDVEKGTSWGSGIEQQNIGFLTFTLAPYLTNIAQCIARDCLTRDERRRHVIRFDTAIFTRADFLARQNGLAIQRRNGVISANDWRRIEGLNPIDSGDDYLTDQTLIASTEPNAQTD